MNLLLAPGRADETAPTEEVPKPKRRRWLRWAIVGVVGLVLIGAAAAAYVLLFIGAPATAVDPAEEIARFRATEGPPIVGDASDGLPRPGVYLYETDGGEGISLPNGDRTYPDAAYLTVAHRGGCEWESTLRSIEEHVERRTFCSSDGELALRHGSVDLAFFTFGETTPYACEPAEVLLRSDPAPGPVSEGTCTNPRGVSRYTVESLGIEEVVVGGESVEAHHVVERSSMEGESSGEALVEWWIHPISHLPLRIERHVESKTSDPIDVTYYEDVVYELTSVEPAE